LKKPFSILVILLLVSLVSMTMISQVEGVGDFRIYIDPASIVNPALDPQTSTIRPNLDGTFKNWTKNTVVLRPNAGGTYTGWTGNILRLDPSGTGTYSQWSAWTHLQPRREGNWTGWANDYRAWDDWPDPDGDTSVVSTGLPNYNQTSDLTYAPTESRVFNIDKVRVNIVARQTTGDENITMMLCTVLNASVSGREEDAAWNGWSRVGDSPWLNKEDYNAKYIYTSVTGDKIGNFTFPDVPTGITWWPRPTGGVQVTFKIWQSPGGDDTIKIYLYDGTSWNPTPFIFSQGPPLGVDPAYAAYRDVDATSYLNTIAKINAAKMAIEKVTVGAEDTIYIDYACIRLSGVTTSSSFGSPITLGTTYTHYYSDWLTNPLTGSTWTWPDIDALQAGVKSVRVGTSWTGELRVTQLYVGILTSQGPYTYWNKPDLGPNGGDADYFTATADAKLQSAALPNPTQGGTIAKVQVTIVARTNITTDEKVQMFVGDPTVVEDIEANVDGFTKTGGWTAWTRVPTGETGPWLSAADYPSNYIYTSVAGDKIATFSFANVPAGVTWSKVTLRIKTWDSGDVGGSDGMNIELNDGGGWGFSYTVYPTSTVAPGTYMNVDVSGYLNSEAKINAAQMRITKVTVGTADTIYVDHAYLLLSRGYGLPTGLTTTYTEYTNEWSNNPATGSAWTWSAIDNLEAGAKSVLSEDGVWTGEIRVTQLYVKVIEAQTHQNWDDTTSDGDATYLSAISDGLDQSSQLTDTTDPGWTPARVQVTIVARTDIETDEWVQIMLVIGTTQYLGEIHFPSASYATYSSNWETNPATLGSWDWTAINGMQAGVKSILGGTSWTGEIRVTQLYVVVGQDGTYDDWNDVTPDGDATYVSATMGLMQESSQLDDIANPGWTIGRVRVVIVAKTDVATDEQVQPMLIIGVYAYPASPISLNASYVTYTADWGKNPSSKTFWEWSDLTNLEVGVTSIQTGPVWIGEIRVTQLYVEIAGPRFTVDVKVENVVDLSTYTFKLKYNTAVTSATGIIPGSFFSPITYTWAEEINDAAGYITYSVTGAGGWLDAADYPAKYIYQTSGTTNYKIGNFVFANVSTGITWTTVTLRIKTWKTGDVGGSDYMKIYLYDGSVWSSAYTVTPPTAAAPGSYVDTVVTSFLSDGAKINATLMRIEKVTVGTADTIYVDHAQLLLSGGVSGSIDLNVDGRIPDAAWNGWTRIGSGRIGSGTLATIIFLVDSTGATTLDLCIIDLVNPTLKQIHWILGDVDGDRTVDISDLSDLSNAYGSKLGDSNWGSASKCDFNTDGKVDAYDLFAQGKNYTKTYSYDGYFSNS